MSITERVRRTLRRAGMVAALALLGASAARAHDPGLSEIVLTLAPARLEAVWWIDAADLLDPQLAAGEAVQIEIDGARAPAARTQSRTAWDGHHELRFAWPRAAGERMRVTATLLERLPLGHRVLLRLVDAEGWELAEQVLSARSPALEHRLALSR